MQTVAVEALLKEAKSPETRRSIRPKTQIEVLAEKEREKQAKKAAKKEEKAAKAQAKKEADEIAATGFNKQLSKKERKKLEQEF